ncbi:MAG TPA: uroporphyrinogen decarboxylase family protein [Armatimonadota bacterium]|nr:uroporphyrinogen decarboxylase family protein [Armatimonadota bacterium]
MTPRERLLTVLGGGIPDCVPVAPDFSNMIPARLTGKPFWDLYLYNDPPIWEAYINCAKHFNIDALMDGYFPLTFPEDTANQPPWERCIVYRDEGRIVTQSSYMENGKRQWAAKVDVFYVADSPTWGVPPERIGLPLIPTHWEPVEGVQPVDRGPEGLKHVKSLMGDQGLVGVFVASTCALGNEEAIYNYYDHPEKHQEWAEQRIAAAERRFRQVMAMPVKPDFLCVGGSGSLIFQTVDIFRQLAFPAVKRIIELASAAGMPTHVHCCGPEKELIKILAEETTLTVIDPLEIPPMGDCNLAEIKRLYGRNLTLKGNLHTTDVMLRGSVDDVITASKQAIDDAATGGRFILSTGDQCGRDTPDENLQAMVATARTYGRYA